MIVNGVYIVSRDGWLSLLADMTRLMDDYHRRFPLRRTMPREELRSRLNIDARLFRSAVARAATEGLLVEEATGVRFSAHRVQPTAEQEANAQRLLQAHRSNPYAPPTGAQAVDVYGIDAELLRALVERGDLVSVEDDVFFLPPVYKEMVSRIVAWIEHNGSITVGQARDMFSPTRRYIMALLEHLDLAQITRRVGDARVLRQRPESTARSGKPVIQQMEGN